MARAGRGAITLVSAATPAAFTTNLHRRRRLGRLVFSRSLRIDLTHPKALDVSSVGIADQFRAKHRGRHFRQRGCSSLVWWRRPVSEQHLLGTCSGTRSQRCFHRGKARIDAARATPLLSQPGRVFSAMIALHRVRRRRATLPDLAILGLETATAAR
jgi:hypothetical protein